MDIAIIPMKWITLFQISTISFIVLENDLPISVIKISSTSLDPAILKVSKNVVIFYYQNLHFWTLPFFSHHLFIIYFTSQALSALNVYFLLLPLLPFFILSLSAIYYFTLLGILFYILFHIYKTLKSKPLYIPLQMVIPPYDPYDDLPPALHVFRDY